MLQANWINYDFSDLSQIIQFRHYFSCTLYNQPDQYQKPPRVIKEVNQTLIIIKILY